MAFHTDLPMTLWQWTIIVAALLLAAVAWHQSRRSWLTRVTRKSLMTPNEREFFQRLQKALPACHVFPQVAFGAFLTDDGRLSGKARWNIRARFDRKIADFLICEPGSFKVLAIVELDDRMHDAGSDRQRDAITEAAGYRTIRFTSKRKPSVTEIADRFALHSTLHS